VGEAKQRRKNSPTFGRIPQEQTKLYKRFAETVFDHHATHGRGCHITSSQRQESWIEYAPEEAIINGNFGAEIRRFSQDAFEKLVNLVKTYEPNTNGIHLHLAVDGEGTIIVKVTEFPISVTDSGELDSRSSQLFHCFAEGVRERKAR